MDLNELDSFLYASITVRIKYLILTNKVSSTLRNSIYQYYFQMKIVNQKINRGKTSCQLRDKIKRT